MTLMLTGFLALGTAAFLGAAFIAGFFGAAGLAVVVFFVAGFLVVAGLAAGFFSVAGLASFFGVLVGALAFTCLLSFTGPDAPADG